VGIEGQGLPVAFGGESYSFVKGADVRSRFETESGNLESAVELWGGVIEWLLIDTRSNIKRQSAYSDTKREV
jgi:hypothetical protein